MANVVYIEKRPCMGSPGTEYQVSDQHEQSEWFKLPEFADESAARLVYLCSLNDDAAGNIINAASYNNTYIETPFGDLMGSEFSLYLEQMTAQEDAEFLNEERCLFHLAQASRAFNANNISFTSQLLGEREPFLHSSQSVELG